MMKHVQHRAVAAAAFAVLASFGLVTAPASLAATSQATPQTTSASTAAVAYQIDPQHDGSHEDPSFSGPLSTLWTHSFGASVYYPLIVGDQVFVDFAGSDASSGSTGDGTSVEAFDLSTGDVDWGPTFIGGTYAFGALAYDQGRVFALNGDGLLRAFDASTGVEDWSTSLPGQWAFTSAPTAVNGTVYVGGAGSGGTLYAVNESSGAVRWTAPVENGDSSSPAVDDGKVFVGYACEQDYAFDATTGALDWHHTAGCEGGGGRTPVVYGGGVYERDEATYDPVRLDEATGTATTSYESQTAPAFYDGDMVTLFNGTIHVTDTTTGQVLWSNADRKWTIAPIVVDGLVVAGAGDGTVALFDITSGQSEWSGSAGQAIEAPDEHNAVGVTGLAEAEGVLAVPTQTGLTVMAASDAPRVWFTGGTRPGATVGASAVFDVDSNDGADGYTCSLDGQVQPCASPVTYTGLSDGRHTLTVTTVDSGASASVTFYADRQPPVVTLSTATRYVQGTAATATWRASDNRSGVAAYDVRVRTISGSGRYGAYSQPSSLQQTTQTTASVAVRAGSTLCFSVRARDKVGNVSAWSPDTCSSRLADDRALTASAGWYRAAAQGFMDDTFTGSTSTGASLTSPTYGFEQVAVLASICPTCGKVAVILGRRTIATVSLASSSTGEHLFVLPPHSFTTGRLVLRVVTSGKQVQIDGLGIAPV